MLFMEASEKVGRNLDTLVEGGDSGSGIVLEHCILETTLILKKL